MKLTIILYYFAKVNPYRTFIKMINNSLKDTKDKNIYTKNRHKELKKCYEQHWKMKVDVGCMETLLFNYPIREWRKENNNDELLKVLNKNGLYR